MTFAEKAVPQAPLKLLGLACAVGVSTIYFNQPLLLEMGHTYGTTPGQTGFVAMATQVGYACGMLLFVPLGDLLERRSLMMRMYAAVAVALLLVAVAPTLSLLIAASIVMGLFASVTHVALPIAPDLVQQGERGRAIGVVMTGLLLGILLARTFAGWVSGIHGWRWVFVLAAVLNGAFVPLLWRRMPLLPPKLQMHYGTAMRSLWTLWQTHPLLRESALMGALVFASFSVFWTTLAFVLGARYGLGAGVAGTFGLVGAAGALVAPLAGRMSDKHGTRWVLTWALVFLAVAYGMMWGEERLPVHVAWHMGALVLGVILLDVGTQMAQIGNQTRIFGLDGTARSRLNTVYMTVYFIGGATGSALATMAWSRWKWNGVCALELVLVGLVAVRHVTGKRDAASPRSDREVEVAAVEALGA